MSVNDQYKPEYKIILQCLLIQQMSPYTLLQNILETESDGEFTDLDKAIRIINETISVYLQKIVILPCELTGEKMCVLVSTAERPELKCNLTQIQSEYLYELVHAIITSEHGFIGSIDALNLSSELEGGKVTRTMADEYLRLFLEKKLLLFREGMYFLSALSIAELGPFISENFDIDNCHLCKQMVICGEKCLNCDTLLHKHCFSQFRESFKKTVKCPNCKNEWGVVAND